jgi:hypothetical protein
LQAARSWPHPCGRRTGGCSSEDCESRAADEAGETLFSFMAHRSPLEIRGQPRYAALLANRHHPDSRIPPLPQSQSHQLPRIDWWATPNRPPTRPGLQIQRQRQTRRPRCHRHTLTLRRRCHQRRRRRTTYTVSSTRLSVVVGRLLLIISGADSAGTGIKANPAVATTAPPSMTPNISRR